MASLRRPLAAVAMLVCGPLAAGCAGSAGDAAEPTATEVAASREVTFNSDGLDLVGTVRLPEGDGVPGVVLIHGSGPNSRDQVVSGQLNMTFGFEIPVFAEIAEGLRAAGFAVLTYDKRVCGTFNGCATNEYPFPSGGITVDDFVTDAEAAVEALRSQPEVDPEQVSIVGHSQGGEFVTSMLAADPRLASGVMLAAPFRPIDEIFQFQHDWSVELLVEYRDVSEERARASSAISDLQSTVDGIAAIRSGGDTSAGGASAEFWQSWLDLSEAKLDAAEAIEQPVLVLHGDYDWNVPPSEAQLWDDLFTDAGVEHTTAVLECVTHALNCVSETEINDIGLDDLGPHVSDEVMSEITGFLAD